MRLKVIIMRQKLNIMRVLWPNYKIDPGPTNRLIMFPPKTLNATATIQHNL